MRFLWLLGGLLLGCRAEPDRLFTKISSAESGVHFANNLTPNDSLNAFTFTNFYNGGGVGVGDFNRDGKPDLFFTGNQESCRLYVNQTPDGADFQFIDVTDAAGVRTDRWCTGVSVADVNADGWDDIYVSVAAHPTMRRTHNLLFINQKTTSPTFREEAARYGLDFAGYTTQAAFFDYDLDGDLDAFLLNTAPDLQNPNYLRPAINDGTYPSTGRLYRNRMVERRAGVAGQGAGRSDGSVAGERQLESDSLGSISALRTRQPTRRTAPPPALQPLQSLQPLRRRPPPPSPPLFTDVSKQAGIRYEGLGLGLVVSDVNSDGYPDIYCSNDFISSDVLYLNNGDGTFRNSTRASLPHTSLYGMGVDAADVDNDGRIDLMQLDMLPLDNARQKMMLGAQDFDKKELSQTPQYGYQLQYMRNTLQLNVGNEQSPPPQPSPPSLQPLQPLRRRPPTPLFSDLGLLAGVAQTDWSWATLLTDLDGDGQKDIFVTNGYRKNVTDRDFISFTEEFASFGTDAARQQQRDKLLQKVPEIKLRNYAFRNRDTLRFDDVSTAWGLDELSYANGSAYADLDGDGDLDIIVSNIDEEASLFRNNSREQLKNSYLSVSLAGPDGNRAGIGATVTVWSGGRQQVLENYPVRGYLSSVESGLTIGLSKATIADSVQVTWPGGQVETRYRVPTNQRLRFRFTDAKPVIKRRDSVRETLFSALPNVPDFQHQESDFVDFKTTPALHRMLSRTGVAVAVGDLNGDAYDDIAVGASYRGSAGFLFFGQASGGFRRVDWMPNTPMEVGDILVFDADKDGDNDLLVVGGGNERPLNVTEAFQPVLYRNDGSGRFSPTQSLPRLAVSSQAVRALDYDRDGDSDVLITGRQVPGKYPLPARSYLLRNDKGTFTDVTAQVAPDLQNIGMVCDALPLDYDRDGDDDLILVGEWMPPTILTNQGSSFAASFKHSIIQAFNNLSGWWNCVAVGDFDGDGDPDLLLGNDGLNTLYRASPEQPVQIVGKDFNDDGLFDPIMGYVINGTRYPVLPRDALNQQIIQFRRKFKRYKDYSEATFDDLFSEEEIKRAYQAQVSELRSCYAENRGNGQFALRPLPMLAQQAPIFGFVVDDFDRDGHLDALATGNFYPNEANMGRQDASRGLLLKGDGKGGFVTLGPDQTGFLVSGDARRSYRLRHPDRIVTVVNGGPLVVHRWKTR